MTTYTIQGIGLDWGSFELTQPTVEFTDSNGAFQYQVLSEGTWFDTISVTGIEGLSIDGVPVSGTATLSTIEWNGQTSIVMGLGDTGGSQVFVVIVGAPIALDDPDDLASFLQSVSAVSGAPEDGPFAPGMPISLGQMPGVEISGAMNPMIGTQGPDVILGSEDNDLIVGQGGDDRVLGSVGDDTIYAGAGNDRIDAGVGADTFVFASGSQIDLVSGFEVGVDTIAIHSSTGVDDLTGLAERVSVVDGHTVLDFGGGDMLVIKDHDTPITLIDSLEFL